MVTFKNSAGNFDVVKSDMITEMLGADLATLDAKKAKDFGVPGGVVVRKINKGAINDQTRMKDGFIILKIGDKKVNNVDELKAAIGENKTVNISGFYPGYDMLYDYSLSLGE